jgi:alpha-L-arabinofuranosidase
VYLDGHWLMESATLTRVLAPVSGEPVWFATRGGEGRVDASGYSRKQGGLRSAEATGEEGGGTCLGWISDGHWTLYERVDFGDGAETLDLRVSSGAAGGVIEIRLDSAEGELLGRATVPATGGWQAWTTVAAPIRPTDGVRTVALVFRKPEGSTHEHLLNIAWFQRPAAKDADAATTIWAQFKDVNPNEADVEINARQAVFYPSQPGRNYITVRGFKMMHAATNWAPPTAEQVGLIGTHWSKGWIIEDNEISYSTCTGITLGKHGDEFDNTSADTAEGYVKTIERAQAFPIPWTREHIGHHIIRRNHIFQCEQSGIVGSMGGAFSLIEDNVIRDINIRRLLAGAEQAGIKLHAPIDTLIRRNHIYRVPAFGGGIWLDWMTQGARVTGNILHDNSRDLFLEVNHGPYLIDHNILLSGLCIWDWSQGGAFVHNLIGGQVGILVDSSRETPFHEPHSTTVKGLANIRGGDNRYYNNLFLRGGLNGYDKAQPPMAVAGNVYLGEAKPMAGEEQPRALPDFTATVSIEEDGGAVYLNLTLPPDLHSPAAALVTTERLGLSRVAELPFVQPDGSAYTLDADYFGAARNTDTPVPGPFEGLKGGTVRLKIRPVTAPEATHGRE